MLENKKDEITLIYNGKDLDDKQAISYLKSIAGEKLKMIDITKDRLTESQIARLAENMNITPKELIDKKNKKAIATIDEENMDDEEVVKLLAEQTQLLRTPITLWNNKTEYWDTAYDMIKYEMKFK